MDSVETAVEEVQLGASLASVHQQYIMHRLHVRKDRDVAEAIAKLDGKHRNALRQDALQFVGRVCRHLGERCANDDRVCRVLQEWVRESKDYDAFDALLSHFDFPARGRLLDEARRLFPSTLTAHW